MLHFHFRWGHIGLGWTKSLFAEPRDETPLRKTLKSKHVIHRVDITKILCAACKLGKGHRQCQQRQGPAHLPKDKIKMKINDLLPGDCVSIDQYISTVPDCSHTTSGKEK